jgi:RNA polymerase subunit RPABC4/transcription elongation factor Spt4
MNARLIPVTAWVLAVLFFLGAVISCVVAVMNTTNQAAFGFPIAVGLFIAAIFTVIAGFVYGDARRRGMRYVMWTWLVILIPNGIGIILYFILRDPIPNHCTNCGAAMNHRYGFCPHCGTANAPACGQCHKVVESGWSHCAFCGARL